MRFCNYIIRHFISIHSLRVEGDVKTFQIHFEKAISIHSLRVEGDGSEKVHSLGAKIFQSTPSVWRETAFAALQRRQNQNFNPLPPCGGRLDMIRWTCSFPISIHSLRVEGDDVASDFFPNFKISIHSLRVEGDDSCFAIGQFRAEHFNPLPPCGGRHPPSHIIAQLRNFNPLPPCGGRLLTVNNV